LIHDFPLLKENENQMNSKILYFFEVLTNEDKIYSNNELSLHAMGRGQLSL